MDTSQQDKHDCTCMQIHQRVAVTNRRLILWPTLFESRTSKNRSSGLSHSPCKKQASRSCRRARMAGSWKNRIMRTHASPAAGPAFTTPDCMPKHLKDFARGILVNDAERHATYIALSLQQLFIFAMICAQFMPRPTTFNINSRSKQNDPNFIRDKVTKSLASQTLYLTFS